MSGFDHAAHAAQVASAIEYLAGDHLLVWRGQSFPALLESIPPRLQGLVGLQGRGSEEALVVVTVARALFAAKQVPVPRLGDSLADTAGRNYRIQKVEGAPTDPEIRFTCGSVTALPA